MIDTQQQEPTRPPTVLLYDADAPQRVPMKVERHGKLYLVAHNFRGIKDDDIIEFERTKDVRLSDADDSESDEQSAMAVTSKQFAAAIALWEKLAESVENYALKQPEGEWQKEVSAKDKAFAVNSVLLAVEFVELPVAAADEACPPDDDDTSTYIMRAIYNGQVVETRHVLRAANADEMGQFTGLMQRALLVQGTRFGQNDQRIPSRARGLGELYRKVKIETTGYSRRVPLHHQMAVALHHFRAQHKADTEK